MIMKKLKRIFALCLSLFCVFGLLTPIFAEENDNSNEGIATYADTAVGLDEVNVLTAKTWDGTKEQLPKLDTYAINMRYFNYIQLVFSGDIGSLETEQLQYDMHIAPFLDELKKAEWEYEAVKKGIEGEKYIYEIEVYPLHKGMYSFNVSNSQKISFEVLCVNTIGFQQVNYKDKDYDNTKEIEAENGTFYLEAGQQYLMYYEGCTEDLIDDPYTIISNCALFGDFQRGGADTGYNIGGGDEYFTAIKSGVADIEVYKGQKIHLIVQESTSSPTLKVSNFDDTTVQAGTLDTDVWPKVEWDYASLKDWIEVLSVSYDGGKTWKNEYELSPATGGDVASVPLKVSDSGRKYRLIFTYQGKELYNKTITVTVVEASVTTKVTDGTPNITAKADTPTIIENAEKNKLLSEGQKEILDANGKGDVKVTISKKEPTAEEKKLVESKLNSKNKIAMYLDLGVQLVITDSNGNIVGSEVAIRETGTPITFTVALDDSFINKNSSVNRTYQVVRIHNGEVTVLPATFDANNKTITFASDKFSTYALIYTDTVNADMKKADNASKSVKTSDANNVMLYIGVMSIAILACIFVMHKRKA